MKEYIKTGLATIIPIALVFQVGLWIYNFTANLITSIIPLTGWYVPILGLIGVLILITIIGFLFKHFKVLNWLKGIIETRVINRIPLIRNVYNFGRDLSDSFITDIKDDGDMTVVEVYMGPIIMMGVLTDAKNGLVFVVSAPSPLTGFVMKTDNYKILPDMTFMDLVQINTSLGRINGNKWK